MTSLRLLGLLVFLPSAGVGVQARSSSVTPVAAGSQSGLVRVSADKPLYFPGDTVHLSVEWVDSAADLSVTPFLSIKDALLQPAAGGTYQLIIPQEANPDTYRVDLRISDSEGRQYSSPTECQINVEEFQAIEQIANYVKIYPQSATDSSSAVVPLDRERLPDLQLVFLRDCIREKMGPQFVTINVEIQSRNGNTVSKDTRRMVTFRSQGDPVRDHATFLRYRNAYGPYTIIRTEELERVQIQVDSVPDWAVIKVRVEPDYALTIGANDRGNLIVRKFRVKGPVFEAGLALGAPKVLWDSRAEDSVDYGATSAMLRLYLLHGNTGERYPVSLGMGTFGVDSPIDVSKNRGGFAVSVFLDVVDLVRYARINLGRKVNAGLELTPFFPVEKKARLLLNAKVGLSL